VAPPSSSLPVPEGRPAPAPEPDDFALMAAIRDGSPGAFETLSDRWRPRVVNFVARLGADSHEAEDAAQETLLRVYRYRREYRPEQPFTAFVFTLARRSFLDGRRRASKWERRTSPVPVDEPGSDAPPHDDPALGLAERLDLTAAVASLPRRLRDVVELGAIRGLPYHRVAALLGIPVGTVKSRMHHAVAHLRSRLGR
jgi:RNA polymerase sigma factor (sigma-70 family)